MKLRDYQSDLVERLRAEYQRGAKSVCAVLPTGGGKTAIFSEIARSAGARGKNVIILVHRHELLVQASRALTAFETPHGVIAAGKNRDFSKHVQVGSVQTVSRRLDSIKPDLIVTDECHHATSATYTRIYEAFPRAHHLGVTALS